MTDTVSAEAVWPLAQARLRSILNEDTYDRWIAGIVPLSMDGEVFRLGVSNNIFCDWLAKNYRELICTAISEELKRQMTITFESGHEPAATTPKPTASEQSETPDAPQEPDLPLAGTRFNRNFTFDNFVVGANSRFAHAACQAVAAKPGKAYNPLFIHGPTALGKTHLLQAIAQDVLARRRRARVEFLSSEEFFNMYINALRDRTLPKFREHFRNVHLLLIDDIHFFTGKEQLQEEFFHTFNALYHGHRQIVLTSDRPLHEIGGLEKRLVSRFEWGLTTEILAPELETRLAILRKKQEDQALKLPDDVLFFVASHIKSNIRRLEGALIRLISYASMTGMQINIELAEQFLRPLLDEEGRNVLTIDRIQRAVADFYEIRLADMLGSKRPANIAFPRQVAMFLCRKLTEHSSPAIAEAFSRNHATVLHAENSIGKRLKEDADLRRSISLLETKLQS